MNIQITGVTSNQLNIRRKKNPLFSAAKGLLDFFENEKYEVKNIPELVESDILLYGLYSLNSWVSGGFLKTADVLINAVKKNKKIVFFVDDWHLDSIGKNITACSKDIDGDLKFGEKMLKRKATFEERETYRKALEFIVNSDTKILVHVLPWLINDEECKENFANALNVDINRVVLYDPTMFLNWDVPKPKKEFYDKDKAWVVASRYDFTRFVNKTMKPTWPVIYYGCKKVPNANFVPDEVDLVEAAFRPNWGIVSHPYPSHLQGQWRNKFVFSSLAESIILAYGKEKQNMATFLDRQDIEKMPVSVLETLSNAQKNEMLRHINFDESAKRVKDAIQ